MEQPDGTARARARELGRRALASGVPLLELVDTAVGTITNPARVAEHTQVAQVLDAGHEFVHECVSSYDDAMRETTEGNRALRQRNDHMEEQVRRIAHEIHDSSAQFLASVHTELERAKEVAPGELVPRLQRLHTLLNQVEVDLRRFAQELRPTILDDLGLVPALHELARSLGRNGVIVTVDGPDERFPSAIELALYRTVQEALAGAGRHDRVRRVKVKIESSENEIRCSIADDGSGISGRSSASQRGLGLFGIRERLAALGGTLVSENRSDSHGTRLLASIPLEVSHVTSRFDR
jgi:signal transduction histidine kinase